MSSTICLQISKLSADELLESMNILVMQLEQRFGGEEIDELLYQMIAQRVTRIYSDKSEEYCSSAAQADSFCFNLEHAMELEELKPILYGVLAGIEVQLGSVTAEKLMYQIMYRLGVRNGKYSEEEEDDTDDNSECSDADEGDEEDAVLSTNTMDECIDNKYKLHERQPQSNIKKLNKIQKDDNAVHSVASNDEEMNRANEEFEQRAKNYNETNKTII